MTKKESLAGFLKVSIDRISEIDVFEYNNNYYNVLDKSEIDDYIEDYVEDNIYDLNKQLKSNDFGFILNYIDDKELRKAWINSTDIEDILEGNWFDEYYITRE